LCRPPPRPTRSGLDEGGGAAKSHYSASGEKGHVPADYTGSLVVAVARRASISCGLLR
jgi:hypothetical protein